MNPPNQARVVIIGGGIAGASIAYHLARRGWRDVVVFERGPLVGGTTAHAPGLVGQLRSSEALSRLLMQSVALYRGLAVDGEPGFVPVGSLRLASSPERLAELVRQERFARTVGLEAHLLGAAETGRLCPLLEPEGLEGALFIPSDGSAAASVLARALTEAAKAEGVSFQSDAPVRQIEVAAGRIRSVTTPLGRTVTEALVIAAGIWSPAIGRLAGVRVPLTPLQHQYVETAALPALAGCVVPNVRDPDKRVYLRQRAQAFVVGGYECNPRSWEVPLSDGPDPTVVAFDAQQFAPLVRAATERVPSLTTVPVCRAVNGLESFTPDGNFLLGPAGVEGLWLACGFCAHGISGAGGIGRALADWIVDGDPGEDLSAMDPRRFGTTPPDAQACRDRACDVYRTYYDLLPRGD